MVNDKLFTVKEIWELLETVPDPEIPVISIVDLGVIRKVNIDNDEVEIIITPTYTCLLYTSPSPRDQRGSRMPSSA